MISPVVVHDAEEQIGATQLRTLLVSVLFHLMPPIDLWLLPAPGVGQFGINDVIISKTVITPEPC